MNVEHTIDQLCRTYGVARKFGERLRPLLERASECPDAKRERLMALVERSFAEERRRIDARPQGVAARLSAPERKVLTTVAGILHGWDPPDWAKGWPTRADGGESAD